MAVPYYGDFAEDATVYIPFNTFSSDDPSASVTVTDLADADIMVHKNGSTTQIATDGASVAINFDTITGNHLITIDTSVHADYAVGGEYAVRIEGATVDGATINAWVGAFSIERAGGALALLKSGTYGLSAIKTETAAILADTGTDGVKIADDAITAAKFDESTAFPLKSADTGATAVARTGADSDTLETLSDQLDTLPVDSELADAVADEVYDNDGTNDITFRQAVRLFLSALTGKSTGGGTTTLNFRDLADSKNRLTVTVDANGNRTAVGARDGS